MSVPVQVEVQGAQWTQQAERERPVSGGAFVLGAFAVHACRREGPRRWEGRGAGWSASRSAGGGWVSGPAERRWSRRPTGFPDEGPPREARTSLGSSPRRRRAIRCPGRFPQAEPVEELDHIAPAVFEGDAGPVHRPVAACLPFRPVPGTASGCRTCPRRESLATASDRRGQAVAVLGSVGWGQGPLLWPGKRPAERCRWSVSPSRSRCRRCRGRGGCRSRDRRGGRVRHRRLGRRRSSRSRRCRRRCCRCRCCPHRCRCRRRVRR